MHVNVAVISSSSYFSAGMVMVPLVSVMALWLWLEACTAVSSILDGGGGGDITGPFGRTRQQW